MKYSRIFLEMLILFTLSCTSSSGETVTEVTSTVTYVQSEGEVAEVPTPPVLIVSSVVSEPDKVVYRDGREYLSGVVSPCSVDGGTNRDPCEPRELPVLETSSDYASYTFLEVDFLRVMLPEDDLDFIGTHLVLRGVVQDNSTRCDYYPIMFPNFVADSMKEPRFEQLYDYHCFVDVTISEYIVGEGPPVMTISVNRYPITRYVIDELGRDPEEVSNNPRSWTAGAYEGKEMVVFLSTSMTFAVETWAATDVWFVQRTDENLIQAVSLDRDVTPAHLQDQKIMPLQELVQRAKQAAEERNILTNGRLGVNPRLPLLITDAYDLREFYEDAGAVYGTVEGATVLPPPVPGEDDPAPPTIPTDEGVAVSSVPVPGEETTVPPATDDAGLPNDEVTTTVISTTTTATTTTEVFVATVVPTSEVDSTVATAPVETTTTTTTTELDTTETASTTTTTVAPGDEGGLPESEDGLPGEEQSAPATTASSGEHNVPEAENTTLPIENQGDEQQEDSSGPGQEPGDDG